MRAVSDVSFLVTNDLPGELLVRWDQPLGRVRGDFYQLLAEELEELDGVDRLTMGRYRCTLVLDTDIASERDVAAAVVGVLSGASIGLALTRLWNRQVQITVTNAL